MSYINESYIDELIRRNKRRNLIVNLVLCTLVTVMIVWLGFVIVSINNRELVDFTDKCLKAHPEAHVEWELDPFHKGSTINHCVGVDGVEWRIE